MSPEPAFTVRTYPSFRPARLFRVTLTPDAFYVVRMGGLITTSDAVYSPYDRYRPGTAVDRIIEWVAKTWTEAAVAKADAADLDAAVLASPRQNYRATPENVIASTLEPRELFGLHGSHIARWKLTVRDRKPIVYQIEDTESLDVALDFLPGLLGEVHQATIRRRE